MKYLFIILFLLFSLRVLAPVSPTLSLCQAERIDPYKGLKFAIGMVEVRLDTQAINQSEQAYGYFQVRQVRLDDYYRRTGIKYSLSDMLDYVCAEEVFMYYANLIGYENPGKIAREWNGSGPMTWNYWHKVRYYLIL